MKCPPGMLSLRSCIVQFHQKHNAFKRVSKQLCVYLLYRSVFLAQTRFRSPFFPRLRNAFLTHNQNSFAFIICKNHPESRFESRFYARKVMINPPIVGTIRSCTYYYYPGHWIQFQFRTKYRAQFPTS